MVSQNISNISSPNDVAGTSRGFIPDSGITERRSATDMAAYSGREIYVARSSYWAPVIAGTLTVYTIGVLSEALMFGCHVGAYQNGALSFGWGAAWWLVITACVAYFFGGWMSGCIGDRGSDVKWLRGVGVWALSIPLITIFGAIITAAAGLAYAPNTAHLTEYVANNSQAFQMHHGDLFVSFGGAWTVFFSMLLGLFFATIGASLVPARRMMGNPSVCSDRT